MPDPAMLDGLNDSQRRAVEFDSGPLAVLAGPGTGKTRVITHRVAHLIDRGVRPESIVAVTFSVKAANELRERLAKLVGPAEAERVNAQTFHRLGLGLIRRFGDMLGLPRAFRGARAMLSDRGGIIDSAQHKRLLRSLLMEHREEDTGANGETRNRRLFEQCLPLGIDSTIERVKGYVAMFGDRALFPADVAAFVKRANNALELKTDVAGNPLDEAAMAAQRERLLMLRDAGRVYELYRDACRARGLFSFADLILLPIQLLRTSPTAAAIVRDEWRHFVVDEFQDVNAAMIELLRLLIPPSPSADLCVVGDDDQAIYAFRGADVDAFQHFSALWAGAHRIDLTENYRSRHGIIRTANSIISRSLRRFAPDKVIEPPKGSDGAQSLSDGPEIDVVHLPSDSDDGAAIAAMIRAQRGAASPDSVLSPPWSSFAVIARTNSQAADIHAALTLEGIPATIRTRAGAMEDEGVQDALHWARLIVDPGSIWSAFRLLIRPPLSVPTSDALSLRQRHGALSSRARREDPAAPDPGDFISWLQGQADLPAGALRLVELRQEFAAFNAAHGAFRTLARIVERADLANAELFDPTAHAARLGHLISLLRFASQRESRLDPPGDLAAFLSYLEDLDDSERIAGDEDVEARIDGPRPGEADDSDAVRVVTAHSAKGLEFDTVFVPRISPNKGYPQTTLRDRGPELPVGLFGGANDDDAKTRQLAEERRIFYVACTRAKHRLVLLAKKNKSKSSSTHFLEELLADANLSASFRTRHASEVLSAGAPSGSSVSVETARLDSEIDAAAPAESLNARAAVLRSARRAAQSLARSSLTGADLDGSFDKARAAAESARAAAAQLAILAHVEKQGELPSWAADLGPVSGAFAKGLAARLADAHQSTSMPPGGLPLLKPPLRLSYSAISQYKSCPRCFYLQYAFHLSPAPIVEQVVGLVVHSTLEQFFDQVRKADAGERAQPTRDDLFRMARDNFFESSTPGRPLDRAQLDQIIAQLTPVLDNLHNPKDHILELERSFDFPLGGQTITGRIDRLDQLTLPDGSAGFAIIDYKTGKPSASKLEPDRDDLQLGIYALAVANEFSIKPAELRGRAEYWVLAEGRRGVIDLERLRYEKITGAIQKVIDGILAGRFERGSGCKGECDILGASDAQ